jgi:hypothetical protein
MMRALAPPPAAARQQQKAAKGAAPDPNGRGKATAFGPASAVEVRLAKKHALGGGAHGDGYWSDTDEEEEDEEEEEAAGDDAGSGLAALLWAALPELRDDLEAYALTVKTHTPEPFSLYRLFLAYRGRI